MSRSLTRAQERVIGGLLAVVLAVGAFATGRSTRPQEDPRRVVQGPMFTPTYVPRGFIPAGIRAYNSTGFISREVRYDRGGPRVDPAARDLLTIQTAAIEGVGDPVEERLTEGVAKRVRVRGHPGVVEIVRSQGVGTEYGRYSATPEHIGSPADGIRQQQEQPPPGTPSPDIVTLVWMERPGVSIQIVSAALPVSEVQRIAESLREMPGGVSA